MIVWLYSMSGYDPTKEWGPHAPEIPFIFVKLEVSFMAYMHYLSLCSFMMSVAGIICWYHCQIPRPTCQKNTYFLLGYVPIGLCQCHLINLPKNYIHSMQRIQNQAAKLIMNTDRFDSPVSTMRQLHWLPISFRCKYKMLLLVCRCMKDQALEYLQQKLILRNLVRKTWSATESDLLHIPYNKRKTLADCDFSSAGPKLWNSLTCEL